MYKILKHKGCFYTNILRNITLSLTSAGRWRLHYTYHSRNIPQAIYITTVEKVNDERDNYYTSLLYDFTFYVRVLSSSYLCLDGCHDLLDSWPITNQV